jgi:hypothetical protein
MVGTLHKRLLKFIEIPNNDLNSGCVFRTFVNAIKTYLKYYHSQIINFIDNDALDLTPISIFTQFKPYMEQIKFELKTNKKNSLVYKNVLL